MSSIWHTKRKKAKENKTIFARHKSVLRDSGVDWFIWEPQEFTDAIRKDVIAWCYLDDLLVLETENEDLSDKIGKLEIELDRTKKQMVTKCNQLEIAVDALDRMAIHDSIYDIIARNAMKKIKELEQKE